MVAGEGAVAPSAMVDRVASVLGVFDDASGLSLAQVSRRSGLPRSSAHRILQRLVELGWVERSSVGYRLGMRMFELGSHVVRSDRLRRAAAPVMARLHRTTGLGVHLGVLDGTDVVHVDQVAGPAGRSADWPAGTRTPAAHCAPGWALLASVGHAGAAVAEAALPLARSGAPSAAELTRVLDAARERGGTAIDRGVCLPGVTVVAIPVGPVPAESATALAVSGRHGLSADAVLPVLRTAVAEIWDAAAGLGRPRRSATRPLSLMADVGLVG